MDVSDDAPHALRLLADPLRWRLLRLVARERLNVGEATRVLGLSQSGVSRHARLLVEAGLLAEERRGGFTYLAPPGQPPGGLARLWGALDAEWRTAPDRHGDDARLAEVLRERAEQAGAEPAGARPAEPGRSWAAWAQALALLVPPLRVVHLGAGRGALTREVARFASEVLAVEPDALTCAAAAAALAPLAHVRVQAGPLTRVEHPGGAFDLALLAQALGPVEQPRAALAEAARLVRPGGRVLVLDLLPHREAWVRERLGHRRLGLAPAVLERWLAGAGLVERRVEAAERLRGNPFTVLMAVGARPAAASAADDGGAR